MHIKEFRDWALVTGFINPVTTTAVTTPDVHSDHIIELFVSVTGVVVNVVSQPDGNILSVSNKSGEADVWVS